VPAFNKKEIELLRKKTLPPTFSEVKQIELYDAYIKPNVFCKNFVKLERQTSKKHIKIKLHPS